MSEKYTDPKLPFYTDKCKCSVCGEYFNSTYAFDSHRTGPFGEKWRERRCLTVAEMTEKGFSLNSTGHWITKRRLPGADFGADQYQSQGSV